MNIGFDAKRAYSNFTGLGNYSRFVIDGLSELFPEEQYFLYASKTNSKYKPDFRSKIVGNQSVFPDFFWRTFTQVSSFDENKLEVFHGLSNELPLSINSSKVKKILTMHDLIYIRFPQLYSFFDRQLYDLKYKKSCQLADSIIAISEQTANDLQLYYKIPSSKISVIYQDCNPVYEVIFSGNELEQIRSKYQLPQEFIICVGTIEPRKNQLLILQALKEINAPNIKLVIAGKPTEYKKELEQFITENNLQNQVQILNYVDFEDLPKLYQLAKIFVYPSIFEGFGIPILESLRSGLPVISSLGSCFSEAGGLYSKYVDSKDFQSLAKEIISVWNNESLRKEMQINGKLYAEKFRKEKVISQIRALYN